MDINYAQGFPGGSNGKESACQWRRCKRHDFDPWVWKISLSRKCQPTPVFLPGKSHGQRNLEIPWTEKSMEPQRVGPDWAHTYTDMPQPFLWQSIPLPTSQLSWYFRANTDLLKTYFSGTYNLSGFIVGSWDTSDPDKDIGIHRTYILLYWENTMIGIHRPLNKTSLDCENEIKAQENCLRKLEKCLVAFF